MEEQLFAIISHGLGNEGEFQIEMEDLSERQAHEIAEEWNNQVSKDEGKEAGYIKYTAYPQAHLNRDENKNDTNPIESDTEEEEGFIF